MNSYEEGSVLIVNYDHVGIFCYKPKYLDLTMPADIQIFDPSVIKK